MTVTNLLNIDFDQLMDCFLESFENYFVKMPTNRLFYKERWKVSKVDFRFSYGCFEEEKLVGFIINAVDSRNGDRIAFNTGTGVLPAYRGRKIVKSIYEFALPDLHDNGFTKCSLEVITENSIAIKAYESIGFRISKTYKCYKGEISAVEENALELEECSFSDLEWENLPNQKLYSWDNQAVTLQHGNYKYFRITNNNELDSFFAINKDSGYLAQFEVLHLTQDSWRRLFAGIKTIASEVRTNNVDTRLVDKLRFMESIGLENTVDQYEMEMKLN